MEELPFLQYDKYTLEQNQKYYKKKHKMDSSDEHKAPETGPRGGSSADGAGGATAKKSTTTSAPKPTASTTQSDAKSEQAKVAKEIETNGVVEAGLDSEEFGLVCKYEGDIIDLILDTGTVSNLVPEGQRGVVYNIRNETTSLIGVGGARVKQECSVNLESSRGLERFVFRRGSSETSSKC